MGQALAVRTDFTAGEVRRMAKRAKDAAQARRLLAIAAVLDGALREDAAKVGGMDRQTLRDWVIRFNGSTSKERTVSSTSLHRACHPSWARITGRFRPGWWRRVRSQRCTAWYTYQQNTLSCSR
jgi:hypothetical protein